MFVNTWMSNFWEIVICSCHLRMGWFRKYGNMMTLLIGRKYIWKKRKAKDATPSEQGWHVIRRYNPFRTGSTCNQTIIVLLLVEDFGNPDNMLNDTVYEIKYRIRWKSTKRLNLKNRKIFIKLDLFSEELR